ncbi:GH25 family lysozyme [Tardiphaga sp. 42S5]|uniref:GH25 family lysozyme n=1 Tax=Tardiphaga sp. 42S5 TaxID=1404799 RepID=UPI002A5AA1E2|nr:GH25 family lysozyme [Tardiphaga sp. 42S5]WPO42025.1 GH25 family lysozyme [Tardiphaga sp. 42S5]
MKLSPLLTIAAVMLTIAGIATCSGQTLTETTWEVINDDYSRQELFDENIIPAKLREDANQPADNTTSLAIPKDFVFPDDARYDRVLLKERENSIFGIDISHHTGPNIKFTNLRLQRVLYVYAKATQGTGFKDRMFGTYWNQLASLPENQKVYRGAYHFLTADSPGNAQAKSFLDYLELHGGLKPNDMPPCVDLEWDKTSSNPDRWIGHAPEEIVQNALEWLKEVKRRTGRKPMIYTALSWWRDRGIPVEKIELFKDYTIWLADYSKSHKASEKPALIGTRTQDIWQFADNAKLSTGYPSGTVDANIFYGTFEQFKAAFDLAN